MRSSGSRFDTTQKYSIRTSPPDLPIFPAIKAVFETNIRYVGGLISAYELGGKSNQKLIDQAKIVGDHLLSAWVGDNDLPYNTLFNWDNFGAPNVSTGAIIAETGTLVLGESDQTFQTRASF